MGIRKHALHENPEEKILRLCEAMDMPPELLDGFRANLVRATTIGFGLGESEAGCTAKVYLEFQNRYDGRSGQTADKSHPYLSHLGFKWDAADNSKHVVTRYTRFPSLDAEGVKQKVFAHLSACGPEIPGIVSDVVDLASGKASGGKLIYTEVREEENSRSSFDLNVYQANLLMGDIYPYFLKMCGRYSIPLTEFDALYKPVSRQVFGHLAGGIDRKGRDFLTGYFSA